MVKRVVKSHCMRGKKKIEGEVGGGNTEVLPLVSLPVHNIHPRELCFGTEMKKHDQAKLERISTEVEQRLIIKCSLFE